MKEDKVYIKSLYIMASASEKLLLAEEKQGIYHEPGYVRDACKIAYAAVLYSVDNFLMKKGLLDSKLIDIINYYHRLIDVDKVLLRLLLETCDQLHVAGYENYTRSAKTVKNGFKNAYRIIEYVK
jgi:uncharacterized protein (UPF0332 family)